MKRRFLVGFCSGLLVCLLTACTASTHETVAVVESASAIEKTVEKALGFTPKVTETDIETFPKVFAILPLQNTTDIPDAPVVIRSVLQGHLSTKNYQFMHWKKVDDLVSEYQINTDKIQNDVTSVMTQLGVDGVIRGKVLDYEKMFVGVYSHIAMGVYVEMVDLQGKVIWSGEFDVTTRAGGASVTPWGVLLNVALATLNLSDESLFAAADELAREVAGVVPEPPYFSGVAGPVVTSVIHDGSRKVLKYGDVIKVGMRGASGGQASVIIEGLEIADMQEQEPGVYFADIPVAKSWQQKDISIYGRLTNDQGVSTKRLSEFGLVSFDNTPPQAPIVSTAKVTGGSLVVIIDVDLQDPIAGFVLKDDAGNTLSEFTEPKVVTQVTLADFESRQYGLYSLDLAGNASEVTPINVTAYPFPEMAEFEQVTSLPATITQPLVLNSDLPVTVNNKVAVAAGGKLYIAPGVKLKFSGNGNIDVQGELHVYGTGSPVSFDALAKSSPPDSFISIATESSVTITGARFTGGSVGISSKSGRVTISDSEIIGNVYSALMLDGSGSVTLNNVIVDGSSSSAIVLAEQVKLAISNSTFRNNEPFHIQNSSIYPVVITGSTFEPDISTTSVLGEVEQQ